MNGDVSGLPGCESDGLSVIGGSRGCCGEGVCPSVGVVAGKKELSPGGIEKGVPERCGCFGGVIVEGCDGSAGSSASLVGGRSRVVGDEGTLVGSMELMSSQSRLS